MYGHYSSCVIIRMYVKKMSMFSVGGPWGSSGPKCTLMDHIISHRLDYNLTLADPSVKLFVISLAQVMCFDLGTLVSSTISEMSALI